MKTNKIQVQSNYILTQEQIQVTPQENTVQDVVIQIKTLMLLSGVMLISSLFFTIGLYDREQLAKADHNVAWIEGATENFQSYYLFSNGLATFFISSINIILLLTTFLSLTYSRASSDYSYFAFWYKIFRLVILACFLLFLSGLYCLFGIAVAAVQVIFPYYCDSDVQGHVQEEGMRQDIHQCGSHIYGDDGFFKFHAQRIQVAMYVLIPLFVIALIVVSFGINLWWERKRGVVTAPKNNLRNWLNSLDLERDYEQILRQHGITLNLLKKVANSEQLLFRALEKAGVQKAGDMIKIILSVREKKKSPDTDDFADVVEDKGAIGIGIGLQSQNNMTTISERQGLKGVGGTESNGQHMEETNNHYDSPSEFQKKKKNKK